jgi:bifunctional UDP-N-acetylglucosamine pyrophosphorylase/glucosamine-1-phosphate N-acetyltransferase
VTKKQARETVAVILAAGKGTRMKSDLPKVLHPLMGKPIVSYVIDACKEAGVKRMILVIGHEADQVRKTLGSEYDYVEQTEQLGTGHALMMAAPKLKDFQGDLLVLAGDTPFLSGEILRALIDKERDTGAAAAMLTAVIDPAGAYGRIVRENGRIVKIVEARDATPEELKITEVNTSHYCFRAERILPLLSHLETNNDQGEYYLTDVIHMLVKEKEIVESITSDDPNVLMGINHRLHLAEANAILRKKLVDKWSLEGVTFMDPESVYVEPDVVIGNDTVIWPGVVLAGRTRIGQGCQIGPHVRIQDSTIGNGCSVEFAVIERREIAAGEAIGPFAFLSSENAVE